MIRKGSLPLHLCVHALDFGVRESKIPFLKEFWVQIKQATHKSCILMQ